MRARKDLREPIVVSGCSTIVDAMNTIRWICLIILLETPPLPGITPNAVEMEIANLAINHPDQGRPTMVYDSTLNVVARAKALDLARRAYFAHVDPDGYGPNKAVQLAGYGLPSWWGTGLDSNYIESIGGGYVSAQAAFDGWMGSAGHRRHVLAETDFYAGQTRYGVGYAELSGSPYRRYYVFITAPPNENGNTLLDPYIEWMFGHFTPKEIDTLGDASDIDGDGIGRLVEFVLQFDPRKSERMPAATLNVAARRLEWRLPVRPGLGSVTARIERSLDLRSWSAAGVQNSGGIFSIDTQARSGFMRLVVTRDGE